jgi:signal peptidase complex subunit 2
MGKKNQKEPEPKPDDDESVEEEEELELLQVDVGDIMKVKQILDEAVAGTISDNNEDLSAHGDKVKIEEDYRHDNMKLTLMFTACCFAAVAQFGLKTEFPDDSNRWLLGLCCAVYFAISGILQAIMTFVDKDCIMVTKPLTDDAMIKLVKGSGNKEMDKYGIRVRTQFPRFSEFYTVILEFEGKENSECVKQTWSVGKFFDVDGFFDEEGFAIELEELYQRFEKGDFDKPENGAKTAKNKAVKKD